MEYDTRLEDHDSHELIIVSTFLVEALSDTVGQIFDQEGDKKTGHKYGGGRSLVFLLAQAFVGKHEGCMGEELCNGLC